MQEQKGADYMNDERNLGEKTDDSGQQPRYEHYQFHEEQGTVLKPSGPSGHRRNQNSFQKKAGAFHLERMGFQHGKASNRFLLFDEVAAVLVIRYV